MEPFTGIFLVLLAGIFQGTFILPMTLMKHWKWENSWLVFSVFGMLILNLLLAFIFINDLFDVYMQVDSSDIIILSIFGFCWGLGSVLFGLGMDKLGMSLGYPVIMGLIASLGGLIPLFVQHTSSVLEPAGLMMIAGNIVVVVGIIICSKAASQKESVSVLNSSKSDKLTAGIMIAVAAGVLSCLPNIGFSFGSAVTDAAIANGTAPEMAGNAVWALFFSIGFIPNLAYTLFLITKNKNAKLFTANGIVKNMVFGFVMAIMWIGSFYLYGIGSLQMGSWGNILGWPLFISISIVVGNIWGIWRGEWKNANASALRKLNLGMFVLIIAMIIIGLSNMF